MKWYALPVIVAFALPGFADNLMPDFPPSFQPGPFPLGIEPVRHDAPVDESDPDGVLHEYTAYKGTVVVDGKVDDEEWAKIPWTLMEFNFDVPTSQEGSHWDDAYAPSGWDGWTDLTAWFKVLHDDNYIYVAVMRYDDDYSFDPATHNSTGNIWQNDAYQIIVDTRAPGAFDEEMPGAEVGICLVDNEEAYNFWPTSHQHPAQKLELADGDCASTITTATDKAIHGVITQREGGYMEVIEAAFIKYDVMEDDMLGMFSICALDRDYDIRESVDQWAQGIYVKDSKQYGSILWSSKPAPASAVRTTSTAPRAFLLRQNYPNPFNPVTSISFSLAEPEEVTLKVFSLDGTCVGTLIDHRLMPAGEHMIKFDASQLESGVYFYRLETPSGSLTRKMTVLK
ncbi:MAG: T9SS type A sorting domain-containing protein [candidate division KSB1 bacterium]|nr:T9SS type A sorting domain-containing protein [candidate division KSB1 bacterium]